MTFQQIVPDSDVKRREHLERLFVENLPVIDRILGALCARNGYHGDEADEVCSWVKARLIESEYAALAKFRGESSLASYLAVVLAMQVREYRVAEWGRWRPSAVAREMGELAVRLETLVHRDGMTVRHAAEALRTAGHTSLTTAELTRLAASLPDRAPLRPRLVGTDAIDETADLDSADAGVDEQTFDRERQRTHEALEGAMRALPTEERVMLRLRYWEGLSVADVARGLSLPQKPLYRRLEHALRELRTRLQGVGVTMDQVQRLVGASLPTHEPIRSDIVEPGDYDDAGPSIMTTDQPALRPTSDGPR